MQSQFSKRAAHNLDDLYQRWVMRHEKYGAEYGSDDLDTIEFPAPLHVWPTDTSDECERLRNRLVIAKADTVARITSLKSSGIKTHKKKRFYHILTAEVAYYDQVFAMLNPKMKELNIDKSTLSNNRFNERIEILESMVARLEKRIANLEKRLV